MGIQHFQVEFVERDGRPMIHLSVLSDPSGGWGSLPQTYGNIAEFWFPDGAVRRTEHVAGKDVEYIFANGASMRFFERGQVDANKTKIVFTTKDTTVTYFEMLAPDTMRTIRETTARLRERTSAPVDEDPQGGRRPRRKTLKHKKRRTFK